MIEELVFEEGYFEEEEREGFVIESMMKQAWAAQLVVLREIDRICRRHRITYFADWGTLLGAVRHKGFIPWDDDIDIAMKRRDYIRFLKAAEKELPEEWGVLLPDTSDTYPYAYARVVNSHSISFEKEHLSEFFGCPYVVGIDIFPLDTISRDRSEAETHHALLVLLIQVWTKLEEKGRVEEEILQHVEEVCGVKIDRNRNIRQQILILIDRLSQIYQEEDGDEYTLMFEWAVNEKISFKKEWYDKNTEMKFENISIPVPTEYDKILKVMYGEYEKPVKNTQNHVYPFYKKQQEALARLQGV